MEKEVHRVVWDIAVILAVRVTAELKGRVEIKAHKEIRDPKVQMGISDPQVRQGGLDIVVIKVIQAKKAIAVREDRRATLESEEKANPDLLGIVELKDLVGS